LTSNSQDLRIIHHNDCTWCIHRKVTKGVIDGKYELETCEADGHRIPAPRVAERYCEQYQQERCICGNCNLKKPFVVLTNQRNYATIQITSKRTDKEPDPSNPQAALW
jgi:hypothetical protein